MKERETSDQNDTAKWLAVALFLDVLKRDAKLADDVFDVIRKLSAEHDGVMEATPHGDSEYVR